MDVGGSIKRIKVEHSYAYSNESPGQYTDAGDPEEDPLLISPEDVKVEINHDFVLKTEEPDEYSYGVEENVTKFETSMVTDEPVETNFDNCYEQKTSEEVVCKTEVEETVECSKNFSNQVVSTASNPFALTNCFAQVIPNTIVIPNFSQLESHNESVKRSLEDLKNTNSRLTSKADKLTAANLKIKLELKALKKENAALKKEKYNALSKSETGQLDVKKLELELRCSKNRETLLEKKVSMLRTQVMRKPVSGTDDKTLVSALHNSLKECEMERDAILKKQLELNVKFLQQEAKLRDLKRKNLWVVKQDKITKGPMVSMDKILKEKLGAADSLSRMGKKYNKAMRQIQIMQKSLKSNCEIQTNYREEIQKAKKEIDEKDSVHNQNMLRLQNELARTREILEKFKSSEVEKENERRMNEYEERIEGLKAELSKWKDMHKREKGRRIEADVMCKNLCEQAYSLDIELQQRKVEHKQKEERSKKCQYCGFE